MQYNLFGKTFLCFYICTYEYFFETMACKKLQIKLLVLLTTLGMQCILLLLRILKRDFLCKQFGMLAFVHLHGRIKLLHYVNSEKVF